ncbi:glycosyltransferase [Novosphingobium sp. ZW T3_23]|uniref:glycosyltransferase n=1 Tax=Novosphingobium sp. ZW T3_23 TaxID=3378084 RepID=UPI00385462EB
MQKKMRKYVPSVFLKKKINISSEEREFLSKVFNHQYYARISGSIMTSESRLFDDFINRGLTLDFSPTPLFERELFAEREGSRTDAERSLPAILRWYRDPQKRAIVASRHFDVDFYAALYPDVAGASDGTELYEHYLRFGEQEARRPNALFDVDWYDQIADRRPGEERMGAYSHFLAFGMERGAAPSAALLPVFARTPTVRVNPQEAYRRVEAAVARWTRELDHQKLNLLLLLFNPDTYNGNGTLKDDASGLARLEHFLASGLLAGIEPGPLFSNEVYAERAGLQEKTSVNRLLHFIEEGSRDRLVPTALFDEAAYLAGWADIRQAGTWGFGHFIASGIFEGRTIDGAHRVRTRSLPFDTAGGQLHNWQLFWTKDGGAGELAAPEEAPRQLASSARPTLDTLIEDRHLPMVKGLFCPPFYAREAKLDVTLDDESLFQHYLEHGAHADIAPGPLFDPLMARALVGTSDKPAIVAWLAGRRPNWRAPTRFFDKTHYLSFYRAEFHGMALDLFDHFVLHGLSENRVPNAVFDPHWYQSAYVHPETERDLPAYLHYLLYGAARGLAPSQLLLTVFDMNRPRQIAGEETGLEPLFAVDRAIARWRGKLEADQLQLLLAMFSPYAYDGGGTLEESASGVNRLVDFLDRGLEAGLAPSPLFDADIYRASAEISSEPAFLHYLRHGWYKQIVPTASYSEKSYLAAHADIREHKLWGFRHFLFHGLYEGRKVDETAKLTVFVDGRDAAGRQLNSARLFWAAHGVPTERIGLSAQVGRQQEQLNTILRSDVYTQSVRRALALDPAIGDISKGEGYHAPPTHDSNFPALKSLHDRIPDKQYHTIVCVPWLRTGGADLVACQLATAVKLALPDENVLLLRVDQENFDRPDWISPEIDVAHVSDILKNIPEVTAQRLLFVLFKALQPKRVINVNSHRTWRIMERFGKRLQPHMELYSYMFCWDQTAEGFRVGYPSLFYPSTGAVLTGLFTDTEYLRNELLRIYNPPSPVAARILPLFTPSRTTPPAVSYAHTGAARGAGRRPRILWAGRLDRQKRFDLVQKIAQEMPDVDFLCWGDAVLDTPPDFTATPRNLTLRPGFKSYDELPLDDADLWLFTSAWEGMPTILIEMAVRGMAVVASQVGGVPELIDEETGYPVEDVENVEAYIAAIREALENPQQRIERAVRLQKKAADRYSQTSYVRDLREIFAGE